MLRYVPKHEELKYTFGGAAPTHRIKPGTRIVSWTEDCFDGAVTKPGQLPSKVDAAGPRQSADRARSTSKAPSRATRSPSTSRSSSRRATTASRRSSRASARSNGTDRTAMLGADLPETSWLYDVDRAKDVARTRVARRQALVGGAARAVSRLPRRRAARRRGALDDRARTTSAATWTVPEVRAGNTVFLGVNVPGALLSFGDGHYAMGDGEIIGRRDRRRDERRAHVDLIKGRATPVPRIENARRG